MVSVFPRGPVRGGIEAAASQLVAGLARHNEIELHVAAFHPSVGRPFSEVRGEVRFTWLPRWRRFSTLQMLTVAAAQVVRLERRVRPHLLHAQGPTPAALVAKQSSRPMVFTVHGLEPLNSRRRPVQPLTGPLGAIRLQTAGLVIKLSVDHAVGLVAISPYVLRVLGPRIEKKLWVAIENPVADEFFELRPPPDAGQVLCLANLSELKNQLLVVRAFGHVARTHPTAQLILAGPASDRGYAMEVQRLIGSLGLTDRIRVIGEASPQRVLDLYSASDVVVLGSIQETAPLALAQAMAAGRPIVATAVGGVPDLVRDDVTGTLVPSGDHRAMAVALMDILADRARGHSMGRAARAEALQRFATQSVAAQTAKFYERVLTVSCAC